MQFPISYSSVDDLIGFGKFKNKRIRWLLRCAIKAHDDNDSRGGFFYFEWALSKGLIQHAPLPRHDRLVRMWAKAILAERPEEWDNDYDHPGDDDRGDCDYEGTFWQEAAAEGITPFCEL